MNILFPLLTFEEEEKNFMLEEPETYISYIEDSLTDFKYINFRTALCFLLKKILENYDNINIVLNYVIEMLMYIFDMESGNNNKSNINTNDYSIYLSDDNKFVINNFSDEIKIDFGFMIILLMKKKLEEYPYIFSKFKNFFVKHQEKIHILNSDIILIKVCEIYKQYSSLMFSSFYSYKEIEEKVINSKKIFIEKMINFLLNLVLDSNNEALVTQSSQTIIKYFW